MKTVDGYPCTKVIREEFEAELPSDENAVLDENNAVQMPRRFGH